jgi:hypothetical protein
MTVIFFIINIFYDLYSPTMLDVKLIRIVHDINTHIFDQPVIQCVILITWLNVT